MKRSINLLPENRVRFNSMKRLAIFWAGILCVFVIVLAFLLRTQAQRLAASEDLLRIAERRITPLTYMQQESASLENDLKVLAADKLLPTGQGKSLTLVLAKVLSQVKLSQEKLSIEKVSLVRSGSDQFTLKIFGVGTSTTVVQRLVDRLAQDPLFQSVSIESNQDWDASGIVVRKYALACQL